MQDRTGRSQLAYTGTSLQNEYMYMYITSFFPTSVSPGKKEFKSYLNYLYYFNQRLTGLIYTYLTKEG